MNLLIQRRTFIEKISRGALFGAALPAAVAAESSAPSETKPAGDPGGLEREVRLERLRPREIERAMEICPVLFQPLGTIEWHGLHNIVGLDAVKAHHLCVRAAQRRRRW